jgi:transposase InsO family protein
MRFRIYSVSPQLISRWRTEFLENMPSVFDKKAAEKEDLINQIGQLTVEYPETALELKQMTKKYMHHYNWNRQHQSLEDQTPASIYFNSDSAMANAV